MRSTKYDESARVPVRRAVRAARRAAVDLALATDAAGVDGFLVPGYEILSEIHRGGQGVVFRALQQATGRDVAIKVLHDRSLFGPAEGIRFEREVRILGQLQHPNIVTIHASGIANGSRYFVMDYIAGHPLDVYLAGQDLAGKDREAALKLGLFVKICEAVNAAHLHGIIHRDLKPGNIRVDDRGEPHVLDFGLAKFTEEGGLGSTGGRAMTMTGQFVGSLPWASPEQAEGSPDRIDIRTDVYSLGVILFHMLTGGFPYRVVGNLREVLDNIVNADPAKPTSMCRGIDRDVETIVLKCLAKEPDQRYQSAAALADDVRRALTQQPILARAPNAMYQLRQMARRHKLPFAFVGAIFALVTGFAVWMSVLYAKADAQRSRATAAEKQADVRREETAREAEKVKAINEFLINDMLAAAGPGVARGRELTVEEVLDNASRRTGAAFEDQPLIEASVRTAIGRTYLSLGLFAAAEAQLREAEAIRDRELGHEHRDTLRVCVLLTDVLHRQDKLVEAQALAERTLAASRRTLGDEHEIALEAASQYAWFLCRDGDVAAGLALYQWALKTSQIVLGDRHPLTVRMMNRRADHIYSVLELPAAEDFYRAALDQSRRTFGEGHPYTLRAMSQLGMDLANRRRFTEAETLLRDSLEAHRRILGDEHSETVETKLKLASMLREASRLDESEALIREAVDACLRTFGEGHPLAHDALQNLANTLMRQTQDAEALVIYHRVLQLRRTRGGEDEFRTADTLDEYSLALLHLGRYAEAEHGLREALRINRRERSADDQVIRGGLRRLVKTLLAQGKSEAARAFSEELMELRRLGASAPDASAYQLNCYARALVTMEPSDLRDPVKGLEVALLASKKCSDKYHYNRYTLALAYEANGQLDQAEAMVRRALAYVPIEVSLDRVAYEGVLVRFLEGAGDVLAAEEVYRDTLAARREFFPEGHLDIAASLMELGATLVRHDKHAEAEPLLRECLTIREAGLSPGHWWIAQAMGWLGVSLVGQEDFDGAEPLLLDSYALLEADPLRPLMEMRVALDRIARFYDARGMSDAAAAYRAKLSEPLAAGDPLVP